jgi:hypothetical protein
MTLGEIIEKSDQYLLPLLYLNVNCIDKTTYF